MFTREIKWAKTITQQLILMNSKDGNVIGVFFPTVESYSTFTDIPKTERLEEQWTCFNEKYLRNHNFAYYLLKQRMARSLRFKMQSDKTMVY